MLDAALTLVYSIIRQVISPLFIGKQLGTLLGGMDFQTIGTVGQPVPTLPFPNSVTRSSSSGISARKSISMQ